MSATVAPLSYTLSNDCPAAWPANASLNVVGDYPFTSAPSDETPSDFVVRTYYETLWMPEMIMPLAQFIPSLRRVVPSSDTSTAFLHSLLAPIFRSVGHITNKYRNDIPHMIATGGTGEDAEEAMIRFAWTHEKRPDDSKEGTEEEKEERWTKRWLQRFERRDTMIQVLLHFLILSLPKPSSPSSEDKKRKRGRKREEPNLQENLQETLDILTDRLCIWRETDFAFSDASSGLSATSERDWLQTFCEDVVRPAFEQLLPPLYGSFREKCFPENVVESDSQSDTDPIIPVAPPNRASRQPSAEPSSSTAALSASLIKPNQSVTASRQGSGSADISGSDALSMLPPRTFARSNSVTSANSSNSQLLNSRREVSMRRSVSVQRDVGAGGGLKGKERERQHCGANGAGSGSVMTAPNKSTVRTARSSSFTLPHHFPDQQEPARSATTFVPETPLHGGRKPSRLFGRAATLDDLGLASQFQMDLTTFDDHPKVFSDDEECNSPGEDVDTLMPFDAPEQATVSDSSGRLRSDSGAMVLVQSTPMRPRARSIGAPLAASEQSLDEPERNSFHAVMIPETPPR